MMEHKPYQGGYRQTLCAVGLLICSGALLAQGNAQRTHPGADALAPARVNPGDADDAGRAANANAIANPTGITYPFPAKGRDLPDDVYWQIIGHSNGSRKRDLTGTRFDEGTGSWTGTHPPGAGFSGHENDLLWNVPVYAPADGFVVACWRVALDGDDPAEAGCGDNPADPSAPCQRPGGGNMVRIWIPDQNRVFFLAHFRKDTVPADICTHGRTSIEDATDKSGLYGLTPELINSFPWPAVRKGDVLGRVGNSGRSGGAHLHMEVRECDRPLSQNTNLARDCPLVAMRFNKADIAKKPSGRDVRESDWVPLNGPLPVTNPRRIVRPDKGIGGLISPPTLTVEQTELPDLTVALDVTNRASPVSAYQWQIEEPATDGAFNEQLLATYRIDGGCPGGVKSVRVDTPTETVVKTFPLSTDQVSINQAFVGFSRADVSEFCLDFARAESERETCAFSPEHCQSHLDTSFVGGADGASSRLRVRMECQNGSTVERDFAPRLNLTCGLEPFGFPD